MLPFLGGVHTLQLMDQSENSFIQKLKLKIRDVMYQKNDLGQMKCKKVSIGIKVILQLGLFLVFLVFFGIPALEKYVKKDTIVITSEEDTNGIEAPAVTFSSSFFGKVGWKSVFENNSVNSYNFRISDHCKDFDDIKGCIEEDTFSFNDYIVGARFGPTSPVDMLMNKTFWSEDLTYTSAGRYYTFKINKNLTHADADYLMFILNTSTVAAIHVHDEKYFLLNGNPLGPPTNTRSIFPGSTPSQYQVLVLYTRDGI